MSKVVYVYSDGGARGNPGPAAIGVLICDEKGNHVDDYAECIGHATNNVAEYTGVIVGLELAKKQGAREVKCFMDSQLAANQLSGKFKVKTPHILTLFKQVKVSEKNFSKVTYTHIPREHEKIRYVDKLVNQALDQA